MLREGHRHPDPSVLKHLKADVGCEYTVAILMDGTDWFQDKIKRRIMYENDFEMSSINIIYRFTLIF